MLWIEKTRNQCQGIFRTPWGVRTYSGTLAVPHDEHHRIQRLILWSRGSGNVPRESQRCVRIRLHVDVELAQQQPKPFVADSDAAGGAEGMLRRKV